MRIQEEIQAYSAQIDDQIADWGCIGAIDQHQTNFDSIQKICDQALSFAQRYKEAPEYSLVGRVETYETMAAPLKSLADKIYYSKSWPMRILGYFDSFKTSEEVELHKTIRVISELKAPHEDLYNRISFGDYSLQRLFQWCGISIKSIYKVITKIARGSTDSKVKLCCYRIFRRADQATLNALEKNKIGGINFSWTIKSIRKDLKEFRKTAEPEYLSQIDGAILELKIAAATTTETAFISFLENNPKYSDSFERPENHKLYAKERRANLAYSWEKQIKSLKPGKRMIIPGGFQYEKSGHAVIYKISCYSNLQGENRYRFETLNTGDGANFNNVIWSHLRAIFIDNQFHSIDYENISLATLADPHFLISMIRFTSSNETQNMNSVLEFIDRYLVRNGADQIKGEHHYIQKWGTCTYDSVNLWLQKEWPEDLFSEFQDFSTERAREQIKEILPDLKKDYDQELLSRLQWAALA